MRRLRVERRRAICLSMSAGATDPAGRPTILLLKRAEASVSGAIFGALSSVGFNVAENDPGPVDGVDLVLAEGRTDRETLLARAAGTGSLRAPGGLVLLLRSSEYADWHSRHAEAARLRAQASAAAPGLRINAIGLGDDLGPLGGALRLVLAAPSMTGQLLWLDGRTHYAVETGKLVRPRGGHVAAGLRWVFVRDLVLACRIGVYRHEQTGEQRIRINLELGVREEAAPVQDRLSEVVCYDRIVTAIRRVVATGHVSLVETLAERVAAVCLEDARVAMARVRIEKLDVYADAESAGVEIERWGGILQRNPSAATRS